MPHLELHTYRASGTAGPCLVLLHGFPFDHRMWDSVASHLPAGLAVVAPDLPGLGRSASSEVEPSLDAAADAVAARLRDEGYEEVVVAGLSMGGYVALALAERHPGLVAGLALLDTRSTEDSAEAAAKRRRIADEVESSGGAGPVRGMSTALLGASNRQTRPDLVSILAAWIEEQPPEGVAWAQRAMATRPDRTAVLSGFAGPALVLVGEEDELAPPEESEHMVAALDDVHYVVVPRAGHMTAVEDPVAVASALADVVHRVVPRY